MNRLEIGELKVCGSGERTIRRLLVNESEGDDRILQLETGCRRVLECALEAYACDDVLADERLLKLVKSLSGWIPWYRGH